METTVYQIEFIDGRKFRVFCANKAQKERFLKSIYPISKEDAVVTVVLNGIHNVNQWEAMLQTLIK